MLEKLFKYAVFYIIYKVFDGISDSAHTNHNTGTYVIFSILSFFTLIILLQQVYYDGKDAGRKTMKQHVRK